MWGIHSLYQTKWSQRKVAVPSTLSWARRAGMTEAEWVSCTHPWLMFDLPAEKATDRKFRLFACACYRVGCERLTDDLAKNATLLAEGYADGCVSWEELTS